MPTDKLTTLTATDLVRLIRNRDVSPVEIVDACIAAIEKINPRLNAVVTLAGEQARAEAVRAERAVVEGSDTGPLHGIPILIKDITETAGIRTTYASPLYADNVPGADAEVVRRLRAAGAIILGKTNTPEFATGATTVNRLFGATCNPWNQALTPGGSSGGSAAAVAAGLVPVAHGTDFGCSIRVPASFCGLVGLRTTPGLIPNAPMPLPWDPGQVHGPLARTASDAALMLDAMIGLDPLWPISVAPPWESAFEFVERAQGVTGLKVAFAPDIAGIGVEPEIERLCREAAEMLAEDGAEVEDIDLNVSEGRDAYLALRAEWMVGQQHARLDRIDEFEPNLAGNVREGLALSVLDIQSAQRARECVWRRFRDVLERYDILLTPTAPVLPFPIEQNFPTEIGGRPLGSYVDWIAPDFLITLVSLVSASVPVGLSQSGLPVGIQIIAPRFSEPPVLALAKHIQERCPIGWPGISVQAE